MTIYYKTFDGNCGNINFVSVILTLVSSMVPDIDCKHTLVRGMVATVIHIYSAVDTLAHYKLGTSATCLIIFMY